MEDDFIEINKHAWNNKVDIHYHSEFYNNKEFINHPFSLNDIELNLLGDIRGKSILHLQCHFGQDSISLNKMGAKLVGVDFSDKAIDRANELNRLTNSDCQFICSDIYDLPNQLNQHFDIVFTSYGTIGWLPDLNEWAKVVSHFLKPGGQFVFAEFHPVIWIFDNDINHVAYSYFKSEPIIEIENGTYADKGAEIETKTISWNHSLSEVFNALKNNKILVESFHEYNYSPYNCFKGMYEYDKGKYRFIHHGDKLPMVYSLRGVKGE